MEQLQDHFKSLFSEQTELNEHTEPNQKYELHKRRVE